MSKVSTKRVINKPPSKVWRVISDFQNIHIFHPFLEGVDQISEEERGLGAIRQCNLYNKTSQIEEVIYWDEGRSFIVEAKEVPIIGVVTGGMSVAPLDESTSEITLDMTYNIGLGIVGKVINVVLLRMVFKHVLNRVLKGLHHHMETGELIGKGGRSTPSHNLR